MEKREKLNFETAPKTFYEAYLTKQGQHCLHEETKIEKTIEDLKNTINLFIRLGYKLERAEKVEIVQLTTLS